MYLCRTVTFPWSVVRKSNLLVGLRVTRSVRPDHCVDTPTSSNQVPPGARQTSHHSAFYIIKENISRNPIKVLIVSHGGNNRQDNPGGEREEGEAGVGGR